MGTQVCCTGEVVVDSRAKTALPWEAVKQVEDMRNQLLRRIPLIFSSGCNPPGALTGFELLEEYVPARMMKGESPVRPRAEPQSEGVQIVWSREVVGSGIRRRIEYIPN